MAGSVDEEVAAVSDRWIGRRGAADGQNVDPDFRAEHAGGFGLLGGRCRVVNDGVMQPVPSYSKLENDLVNAS